MNGTWLLVVLLVSVQAITLKDMLVMAGTPEHSPKHEDHKPEHKADNKPKDKDNSVDSDESFLEVGNASFLQLTMTGGPDNSHKPEPKPEKPKKPEEPHHKPEEPHHNKPEPEDEDDFQDSDESFLQLTMTSSKDDDDVDESFF